MHTLTVHTHTNSQYQSTLENNIHTQTVHTIYTKVVQTHSYISTHKHSIHKIDKIGAYPNVIKLVKFLSCITGGFITCSNWKTFKPVSTIGFF